MFGMASSCNDLVVLVSEVDGREGERLSNYFELAVQHGLYVAYCLHPDIHLSQIASPLTKSPIFPPARRQVRFRSVDTPVENRPRDARASEPPKSTIEAMVPPCSMPRRFVCSFCM